MLILYQRTKIQSNYKALFISLRSFVCNSLFRFLNVLEKSGQKMKIRLVSFFGLPTLLNICSRLYFLTTQSTQNFLPKGTLFSLTILS